MQEKPIVIAIDGLSASGKGTLAKRMAEYFDFAYLDTGILYRAVGLKVLEAGKTELAVQIAKELDLSTISELSGNAELRSEKVAVEASKVAAMGEVRQALLQFQKDFCAAPPNGKKGAVLDGRDIGSVIAPDADVKLFITASLEARALRRYKELFPHAPYQDIEYQHIFADMKARDERDSQRTAAPVKIPEDALFIDTSDMGIEEVVKKAIEFAETKLKLK
ncbi:MAG: (d)CMP kinase [Alphaproteobacteria bacterium]|nr:(d)CMP kinase [Alphaproteobacteria bacterium]MCL2505255.1 (d)CMP kinase [Alphaproteobacteria bacterium]